jgi:DNA invertase Pin-like site-specific DNA recombinase
MPYKSEKIKLSREQDRRVKLTNEQREDIRKLYGTGCYSLNGLAKQYNVSKKTVLLIVNEKSAEKAKQYRKEHWKEWQSTKEEHREAIKKTRKYKQSLYKDGKLKDE